MAMNLKIIFHKIGVVYHRLLVFVHLSPLSLAEKCRIAFGAAVLLILALALTPLYVWMSKLTTQSYYGSERARIEIPFREHFQLGKVHKDSPTALNSSGASLDPNKSDIHWVRIYKDKETDMTGLTETQKKMVGDIIKR